MAFARTALLLGAVFRRPSLPLLVLAERPGALGGFCKGQNGTVGEGVEGESTVESVRNNNVSFVIFFLRPVGCRRRMTCAVQK